MKKEGFTLVELLVLLLIVVVAVALALPNMTMARNKEQLRQTMQLLNTIAAGIEASRVELITSEFVARVNQLNDLTTLNAQDCPWLVPQYLPVLDLRTAWGGRISFLAESGTGRVSIGAEGRSGKLEFSLAAEPFLYELIRAEDFDRGIVFRDGKIVIAPRIPGATTR